LSRFKQASRIAERKNPLCALVFFAKSERR